MAAPGDRRCLPAPRPLRVANDAERAPGVEIVPGFDVDGRPTGAVYDRADVMNPEMSGIYGQSGNLFLTRTEFASTAISGIQEVRTLYAVAVRSRNKKTWPLGLDYTASGMSDPGETEMDTVLRETQEELGVRFDRDQLTRIASWVPRDGFWSRGAVFTAPWDTDTVPFNPDDIEEVHWMSASELRDAARSGVGMKSDMRNFLLSRFWPPALLEPLVYQEEAAEHRRIHPVSFGDWAPIPSPVAPSARYGLIKRLPVMEDPPQ